MPSDVIVDRDWRCLKLEGPLDLALTGVLAAILMPLADAGIPVFPVATYQTDSQRRSRLPTSYRCYAIRATKFDLSYIASVAGIVTALDRVDE